MLSPLLPLLSITAVHCSTTALPCRAVTHIHVNTSSSSSLLSCVILPSSTQPVITPSLYHLPHFHPPDPWCFLPSFSLGLGVGACLTSLSPSGIFRGLGANSDPGIILRTSIRRIYCTTLFVWFTPPEKPFWLTITSKNLGRFKPWLQNLIHEP